MSEHKHQLDESPIPEKKSLFSSSPLLVLAAAGVGGTLVFGLSKFISGGQDSASQSNKGMRWRVGAQATTVGALGLFVVYQWFDRHFIHKSVLPEDHPEHPKNR